MCSRNSCRTFSGLAWEYVYPTRCITARRIRVSLAAAARGMSHRIAANPASPRCGTLMKYEGVRCSIVTRAPSRASAGTSVAAVAPLPITTTRFPATSMPSGQCCGCTTCPPKRPSPGKSGVYGLSYS